jgi:ribosomal protein L11 methyltransferase
MNYIALALQVEGDFTEILMAELGELGFESFVETDDGLEAYIQENLFEELPIKILLENYAPRTPLSYTFKKIEKQNWNHEWESNFSAISVADKIYVRATFHEPQPDFEHEIIITPKMSFGTGHHETTSQMLALQLEINHQHKKVLDVGTGTGILAIFASKLGAKQINAFDIDEWSVENTLENIELNACPNISVRLGTIDDEPQESYDIILANINRNILIREIPIYANFMASDAVLLVSGFYEHDVADIEEVAKLSGLKKLKQISKNQWAAVVFSK